MKDDSGSENSSEEESDNRGVTEIAFVKVMTAIHFGREEVELREIVYQL